MLKYVYVYTCICDCCVTMRDKLLESLNSLNQIVSIAEIQELLGLKMLSHLNLKRNPIQVLVLLCESHSIEFVFRHLEITDKQ